MPEKICTKCSQINQANANYCSACRGQAFMDWQAEQLPTTYQAGGGVADAAVLISVSRIMMLSVVTAGLYFLYWLFITWRQMQNETKGVHYPVWHALTMLVPCYGLFRLHKHVTVMKELALRSGIEVSFTPSLAVVLVVLYIALGLVSTNLENFAGLLALNLIRFSLIATTMILSQGILNSYWKKALGTPLQNMPIEAGERAIIFAGVAYWLYVFLWVL
jgi:hypothetical protein